MSSWTLPLDEKAQTPLQAYTRPIMLVSDIKGVGYGPAAAIVNSATGYNLQQRYQTGGEYRLEVSPETNGRRVRFMLRRKDRAAFTNEDKRSFCAKASQCYLIEDLKTALTFDIDWDCLFPSAYAYRVWAASLFVSIQHGTPCRPTIELVSKTSLKHDYLLGYSKLARNGKGFEPHRVRIPQSREVSLVAGRSGALLSDVCQVLRCTSKMRTHFPAAFEALDPDR